MKTNAPLELFDALGDPIVMGRHYGYSTRRGSWTTVTTGRAANVSATGRITLRDLAVRVFLYGKPAERYRDPAKNVSMASRMMFPIAEDKGTLMEKEVEDAEPAK